MKIYQLFLGLAQKVGPRPCHAPGAPNSPSKIN